MSCKLNHSVFGNLVLELGGGKVFLPTSFLCILPSLTVSEAGWLEATVYSTRKIRTSPLGTKRKSIARLNRRSLLSQKKPNMRTSSYFLPSGKFNCSTVMKMGNALLSSILILSHKLLSPIMNEPSEVLDWGMRGWCVGLFTCKLL